MDIYKRLLLWAGRDKGKKGRVAKNHTNHRLVRSKLKNLLRREE